nr:integrase, catalytic region, zinc finger, CCHC-type, peptidase aspartic, catalytic [Tanacetum cinerariifolium]
MKEFVFGSRIELDASFKGKLTYWYFEYWKAGLVVMGNNAKGTCAAGNRGAQNIVGNVNPGQARQIKCYNGNDKMLLMQAQENGVVLDEEQLLFIPGGQDNDADECDAFDSDVYEAPTAQTMFMENISFAGPVYIKASLSYDLNILSEVHDHDNYQDSVCEHHDVNEIYDDVQPNFLVDSDAEYTGVNSCVDASKSKPRTNTKNNKISPAKRVNKKKVEEHPRTNKSSLKRANRADSSISSKRTIVLWYLDSCCSKHMTGNRSRFMNFIKKLFGTVRFRNAYFGAIMSYGDYVIDDSVISRVYYVEGLGYNLFFVGQFCDFDLEVAFMVLSEFYEKVGIFHQKSVLRTSQQNAVVKRQNRTLMEVAQTMLIFSKARMFLWAEAVATAFQVPVISAGTPYSTIIDQDAPSPSHSPSSLELQPPISHQGVTTGSTIIEDNPFATPDNDPFVNVFALKPRSEASSFGDISSAESIYVTLNHIIISKIEQRSLA